MKVCDFIASYLKKQGYDKIFGYQGGAVTPLIDSFSKEQIDFIQGRHEQASGFMADASARLANKCQIVVVTNGPGATNVITSIANAHLDSIPVLFITGQVFTSDIKGPSIRQNGFQEIDTVSMVKPITKYASCVKDTQNILYEIQKAIYTAEEGRKGAVLLDIPLDILISDIDEKSLKNFEIPENTREVFDVEKVVSLLNDSKKPVIVAGGGIRLSGAFDEFQKFIERTNLPTVTTLMGKDVFSETNAGFSGIYGQTGANLALFNSDLVIFLGSRLAKRQIGKDLNLYCPDAKTIHVDIDTEELKRVQNIDLKINCGLKEFLAELNKKDIKKTDDSWLSKIKTWEKEYENDIYKNTDPDPVKLIKQLSRLADSDYIITTDVGQNQMWCAQGWEIKNGQRFLSSGGLGCMGFSLPCSIGAKITCPDKKVLAFMGDGGFQMNIQELETLKNNNLDIKIVIFNNTSLGMIQENQLKYHESNYVGTKIGYSTPDIEKLADAFCLKYFTSDCLEEFMQYNGNCILEIRLSQSPTRLFLKYERNQIFNKEHTCV